MTTTPPNLTKINHSDIKTSLTTYLKNQKVFDGYQFEGSVIQTLIDLLAYNTYYYAFYSNMMSNEMFLDTTTRLESLVSLVKPLGYTVPGKKSASTTIKLFRDGEVVVSRYTPFSVSTPEGLYYTFYSVNVESLINGIGDNILVVEAAELVDSRDVTALVDLTKQRYILDEEDVDISTIRVEVKPTGGDWEEWTNVNFFPNNEATIYYTERMGNIFTIEFGKDNNLGKSIISSDSVRISYLVSSGSVANDLYNFSESSSLILDVYFPSSGGSDGPDFTSVKFLAPKVFSGQERAVTKQDYLSLLMKNNFISNINQVAIYGGDEVYPPKYGRVFIAFLGAGNSQEIINFLRDKNMLTVLPEYISPPTMISSAAMDVSISPNISNTQKQSLLNKIKNEFNTTYAQYITAYSFNLEFNALAFTAGLQTKFASLGLLSSVITHITYTLTINDSQTSEFSLNYPIVPDPSPGADLSITNSFTSTLDLDSVSLRIKIPNNLSQNTNNNLNVYKVETNGTLTLQNNIEAGVINPTKGYIQINKIYQSEILNVIVKSYNTNISKLIAIASKFNLVLTEI